VSDRAKCGQRKYARPYEVLGVSKTASEANQEGFRTLAKKHHPDTRGGTARKEEISGISAAYDIVGDKESGRNSTRRDRRQWKSARIRARRHGFAADRSGA